MLIKSSAGASCKEDKWINGDEKSFDDLRIPGRQEIFKTVAIVNYCLEILAVSSLQNVLAIILL